MIKINTVIIIEKHTQTQHLDMNEDNRFLNLEFIKDNESLKKLRLKICCTAFLLVVISSSQRGSLMGYRDIFHLCGKNQPRFARRGKEFSQS